MSGFSRWGVAVGVQGALDVQEQRLLNYGGAKLWKRSGSGDPDLQGAWGAWQETGTGPEQTRDQAIANYRGRERTTGAAQETGTGPD